MRLPTILVISLAVCSLALESSNCHALECGSQTTTGNCIAVDTQKVVFTPCSAGLTCNSNFSELYQLEDFTDASCVTEVVVPETTTECPTPTNSGLVATGQYCCEDSDCFSDSCSSGMCEGASDGDLCQNTDEYCMPGYYCDMKTDPSQSKCKEGRDEDKSCTRDNECYIQFYCNIKENETTGKCKKLYSLDVGDLSNNPILCKSNMVKEGKCDALDVYVGTNKLSDPFRCNIGDVCTYKYHEDKTEHSQGPCYCDGNSANTGKGYCGDNIEYANGVMDTVYRKIRYSSSDCSGGNAHNADFETLLACNSISSELYTYYSYSLQQAQYWPIYQSGALDDCLLDLDLFDPTYDEGSYSGASILMAAMAYLIIV